MRAIIFMSAGALALASAANADFVDVQFLGTGNGRNLKIYSPGYTGNVFVGQLEHRLSNGPAYLNGDWMTYCTDLAQYVSSSVSQFELVSASALPDGAPMGAAKAQAIADMYAFGGGAQLLSTTSNDMAAAFQLALWEVIVDFDLPGPSHNLNVGAGLFRATMTNGDALEAGIAGHLASFLGSIDSSSSQVLYGLRSGSRQDQLVQIVPGPGALACTALVSAIGSRGRRRK